VALTILDVPAPERTKWGTLLFLCAADLPARSYRKQRCQTWWTALRTSALQYPASRWVIVSQWTTGAGDATTLLQLVRSLTPNLTQAAESNTALNIYGHFSRFLASTSPQHSRLRFVLSVWVDDCQRLHTGGLYSYHQACCSVGYSKWHVGSWREPSCRQGLGQARFRDRSRSDRLQAILSCKVSACSRSIPTRETISVFQLQHIPISSPVRRW